MLGFGWTEMLVIGVVALIVIGPKDLPVVMARVGKIVGQIRRMGNEFQREINKTTGMSEIRSLRDSITEPLRKTTEDIRREFNAMTPTGVQPSGIIKPADPKAESIVDEIHAAAGMTSPSSAAEAVTPEPVVVNKAPKRAPARAKAVSSGTVSKTDLQPLPDEVAAPKPKRLRKPAVKATEAGTDVADSSTLPKPVRRRATPKAVVTPPVTYVPAEPADPVEATEAPLAAQPPVGDNA